MKTSTSSPSRLRLWEAALFLAFGLTLTAGVWASASEAALAGQVLRLHVIANSDSEADQARKLLVRDAVLSRASQLLDGADDRQSAEAALAPHLDELAQAGADALARYRALRVTIGEGAGHNWWCVVFPPLCLASVAEESVETAAEGVLSENQVALITGRDGGYVLKFKLIEWWEELVKGLGG